MDCVVETAAGEIVRNIVRRAPRNVPMQTQQCKGRRGPGHQDDSCVSGQLHVRHDGLCQEGTKALSQGCMSCSSHVIAVWPVHVAKR